MLVRVKSLGTGREGDAFRAPLPTYQTVLDLQDQHIMYVVIPDDTHPELNKHASAKFEVTGHGPALVALDAAGHKSWYSHLDERYAERKGEFRPEIV